MEDPFALVGTVPSPTQSDSEDSQLDFEDRPSDFFQASAPAAWDFTSARNDAAKLRPFQTSLDDKIRSALNDVQSQNAPNHVPDEDANNDNDDDDDDNDESSGEESDDALDLAPEKGTAAATAKKVKGKKRLAKEKAAASMTFSDLHLTKPLQKAVAQLQWTNPTPIQQRAIPYILAGRDICGSAVTGSGKTAAFILPLLQRLIQAGIDNVTRVIMLLPTRELAAQCHSVLITLAKYTRIRAALIVGGLNASAQQVALRTRPHIIVATPGRLIDHIRNSASFSLEHIEVLIMDEADRLLEMGFEAEVMEIVRHLPTENRQTLLFSATITPRLKGLIKISLDNPVNLAVDPMFDVAGTLVQEFVKVKENWKDNKDALLLALVSRTYRKRTIIFFSQKVHAHRFKIIFGLSKLRAAELHGNLTQAQRLAALDEFRDGTVDFLLCTDLAARGLDIAGVETVINYDMPREVKEYVHRVGRTARAGKSGRACSIVCTDVTSERRVLKAVSTSGRGKLVARSVPAQVVGRWRAWIDGLQRAIRGVLKEERKERELRMAEMEVNKAQNLLRHDKEIYSRPQRTWFQSGREKREVQERLRRERGVGKGGVEGKRRMNGRMNGREEKNLNRKRRREIIEREEGHGKQRMEARKAKRKRKR